MNYNAITCGYISLPLLQNVPFNKKCLLYSFYPILVGFQGIKDVTNTKVFNINIDANGFFEKII